MLKIIIILIAVFIVIYLLFFKSKSRAVDGAELMVECGKCGIFVSEKEALMKEGKYFCRECFRRKK
ncbi:MAG: hypothetical protein LBL65_06180 [Campylobacteraceae bacterium]|jgi:uncharacterized protein|nr:hypothetical protein [Campylobacteraceae bacterium]